MLDTLLAGPKCHMTRYSQSLLVSQPQMLSHSNVMISMTYWMPACLLNNLAAGRSPSGVTRHQTTIPSKRCALSRLAWTLETISRIGIEGKGACLPKYLPRSCAGTSWVKGRNRRMIRLLVEQPQAQYRVRLGR